MFYKIDEVKAIPIQDVCSYYGIALKQKGQNWWGRLRTSDKTPSFSINPEKNIWRDWGISKGGDVVSLVSEIEGIDSGKAIILLGERFGLQPEYVNSSKKSRILPTNKQFESIGIQSKRSILNLDINLEKQSIDELEKLEEKYSVSMGELSEKDKDAYHEIIDKKALPIIYENRRLLIESIDKYMDSNKLVDLKIYESIVNDLQETLNKRIDIYNNARLDGIKLDELKVEFNSFKGIEISDTITNKLEKDIDILKNEVDILGKSKDDKSTEINELKNLIKFKENILFKIKEKSMKNNIDDLYREWRKDKVIDGRIFTWCANENNREEFSKYAGLEEIVDLEKMLKLEEKYSDDIDGYNSKLEPGKEYKILADFTLEDGSFVRKGTSFFIEKKTEDVVHVKFDSRRNNYYENKSRKYFIREEDLMDNFKVIPDKEENKINKEKVDKVKELSDKLEDGIKNLFESDKYKKFLKTMSKFHTYSFRNAFLIMAQKPEATYVAGFNKWNTFNRRVNKGEKGIQILAPAPIKKVVEEYKKDSYGNFVYNNGNKVTEKVEKVIPRYKVAYVFDISQTNGEPLPSLSEELKGNVKDYYNFKKALENSTTFNVGYGSIKGEAKGYCNPGLKRIMIKENMSEVQTIKTLLHEIAHAELHTTKDGKSRSVKEVEAESVAFIVSSYYGIDTSDYSFGYVAGWSSDKELGELKDSLNTIQKAASILIDKIDGNYKELFKNKEIKIDDKKLIDFLGKDTVVINEISKSDLENLISKNKSNLFLQDGKELSIKNEVVAVENKGKYTDVYINNNYKLDKLIYIDDNKNLYKVKSFGDLNKDKNIKEIIEDASKKAEDHNKKLVKGEKKVNEKEL